MTGLVRKNNSNIKVIKNGNVYSVEGFNKILNGIVKLEAFVCNGFEPEIQNLEDLVKNLYQNRNKFIKINYIGIYSKEILSKGGFFGESPFEESFVFFLELKKNFYGDFKLVEIVETETGNEYGKTIYQVINSEEGIKKIQYHSETIIKDETTGSFFVSDKKISKEAISFLLEDTKAPQGYELEIGEKEGLTFVKEISNVQTTTSNFYSKTGLAAVEYMEKK